MKIGILTLHRAVNYGAVLQAYALVKKCNDLGADAEIIDYRCQFTEDYYDGKKLFMPQNWKRLASYLIQNGNLCPNKERYFSFLRRTGFLSEDIYYNLDGLTEANIIYEKFVVGSDQVWNPRTAGFDKAYFLSFVTDNAKKASYAASFGISSIPDELKKKYSELLGGFDNFSVRETAGQTIIRELFGKSATVDLDPTLLFTKEEWIGTIDGSAVRSEIKSLKEFVLIYAISPSKNLINTATKISQNKGIPTVYINDRWRKEAFVLNLTKVNIDEWLFLFQNATTIITDSFHGTAFSIILEKDFISFQESNSSKSSRLVTLLGNADLLDRLKNEQTIREVEEVPPVNFNDVRNRICRLRIESMHDLRRIICNE